MKKFFFLLWLVIVPLFIFPPKAYAIERIYPDSGFKYNLKRLEEKVTLLFKFTSSGKEKYMQSLLEERLLELEYIAETKNIAFIETTSQRYEATAGQLAEFLMAKSLRADAGKIKDQFQKHSEILKYFRDLFSYDTAEWRLMQNDINSLKIYSDSLSSF